MSDLGKVEVSVYCLAYNHEKYIKYALDGFVAQKTNFRFEVIIHDDASTDATADIIRQYADMYPDIIKPIYETENQYKNGRGTIARIMAPHIHGRYVAICEGDDYWTDPGKLQKQYDYLEANPDCSLTFHPVLEALPDGNLVSEIYSHLTPGDYSPQQIFERWTIPTCSTLLRTDCFMGRPYDRRFIVSDLVIFMSCAVAGRIHCLTDNMAVYRRNPGGWIVSQANTLQTTIKTIAHKQALADHFPDFASFINPSIAHTYGHLVCKALRQRQFGIAMSALGSGLRRYRLGMIKAIGQDIANFITSRHNVAIDRDRFGN